MKKNIAIIGMTGNFKSAVASVLASKLEMMTFDCEAYIAYNYCLSAETLIGKAGVNYYKKQVSKAVSDTEDLHNVIFFSADLTLLSHADLKKLQENCYVIFLYADTKVVLSKYSKIRPMSHSLTEETLDSLNVQSQKRYLPYCDFSLEIKKQSVNSAVESILEYLSAC